MKSEIYSKIRREYEDKRANALAKADARLEEVRAKVAGYAELEREIGQISLGVIKEVLKRPEETEKFAAELKEKTTEKIFQMLRLLIAEGFPKDYTVPKFECSECSDTGFAKGKEGEQLCNCFKQKLLENMFEESGLVRGKTAQFDKFDAKLFSDTKDEARFLIKESPRNQILKIKARCEKFISEDFGQVDGKGLLFFGNTGTGKTFMAQCIANELLLKGRTVAYVSAPLMFDKINEARMLFGEDEYEDYFSGLKDAELLVIDDLGTETSTEAKLSNMLQLLNARETLDLTSPHKTIISTNMKLSAIREKYDERIYSRIIGKFVTCQFGGEDLRIVMK